MDLYSVYVIIDMNIIIVPIWIIDNRVAHSICKGLEVYQ
jgi:hypothetical protein